MPGAIGCRPASTPAAYPPTSLQTVVAMNTTMRSAPEGCANISSAKPPRKGTYVAAHTPAETSRTVPDGPAPSRQNTSTSTVAA